MARVAASPARRWARRRMARSHWPPRSISPWSRCHCSSRRGCRTRSTPRSAVVAADETRAHRAGIRGTELLESRSDRQLPQEEKAARATYVLVNDGLARDARARGGCAHGATQAIDTIQRMSPARTAASAARRPTRARRRRAGPGSWSRRCSAWASPSAISKIDVEQAIRDITLPLQHDDIIRQQAAEKNLDPGDDRCGHLRRVALSRPGVSRRCARADAGHPADRACHRATSAAARSSSPRDLSDPEINISYGSYYLRYLLDHYNGNEVAALAAYNAGTGNVDRWGGADLKRSRHRVPRDARLRGRGARKAAGLPRPVRRRSRAERLGPRFRATPPPAAAAPPAAVSPASQPLAP